MLEHHSIMMRGPTFSYMSHFILFVLCRLIYCALEMCSVSRMKHQRKTKQIELSVFFLSISLNKQN